MARSRGLPRELHVLRTVCQAIEAPLRLTEPRVGERVARILLERLLEQAHGLLEVDGLLVALQLSTRLEVDRVGAPDTGAAGVERLLLLRSERDREHVHDVVDHLVLQREVVEPEVRGPDGAQLLLLDGVDQADIEPQPVAEALQAARDHQRDAEGPPRPLRGQHTGLPYFARRHDPERRLGAL